MTDIGTDWRVNRSVADKATVVVTAAIDHASSQLPFRSSASILAFNGSEFVDSHLFDYCVGKKITFTRSGLGNKNGSAFPDNLTRVNTGTSAFAPQSRERSVLLWSAGNPPPWLAVVDVRPKIIVFPPYARALRSQRDSVDTGHRLAFLWNAREHLVHIDHEETVRHGRQDRHEYCNLEI